MDDVKEAAAYMRQKTHDTSSSVDDGLSKWTGDSWNLSQVEEYVRNKPGRCVVLLDGFVVDVSNYLSEHVGAASILLRSNSDSMKPGGASILRSYSVRVTTTSDSVEQWRDASWAFDGGLNNHSRAAKRRMAELRVARYLTSD